MREFVRFFDPIAVLAYFVASICFCLVLSGLPSESLSILFAFFAYASMKRTGYMKPFMLTAPLFIAIVLINPFFDVGGGTALFSFGERAYTLEGLYRGLLTAMRFEALILWFMAFSECASQGVSFGLFDALLPRISTIISLSLCLLPDCFHRAKDMRAARASVGIGCTSRSFLERFGETGKILYQMLVWAFVRAITTADSMSARGFGCAKHRIRAARLSRASCACLLLEVGLSASIVGLVVVSDNDIAVHVLLVCLLALPMTFCVIEKMTWRLSLSRI